MRDVYSTVSSLIGATLFMSSLKKFNRRKKSLLGGLKMSLGKGYLATVKGKKITFKVVNSFPDLKVQFVDSFPDYKVKVSNSNSFSKETIKIQIVTSFPDVKLQKVTSFGDFEAYFD